jgi:hypothetical protein
MMAYIRHYFPVGQINGVGINFSLALLGRFVLQKKKPKFAVSPLKDSYSSKPRDRKGLKM